MISKAGQESAAGSKCVSASICLDNSGQDIVNRLMTRAFEECRAGRISLGQFPDFNPLLQALRQTQVRRTESTKNYKVTTQVHDKLLILESLATKWLQNESTAMQCQEVIDAHNKEFNPEGGLMSDRTLCMLCILSKQVYSLQTVKLTPFVPEPSFGCDLLCKLRMYAGKFNTPLCASGILSEALPNCGIRVSVAHL